MQPYFFPFIGYFQLINAVDLFVFYDDVNYINKGWINRNRILINGSPQYIQVPLIGASQNRLIKDIELVKDEKWKTKLLKTLELNYKKSQYFSDVYPMVYELIKEETLTISDLNFKITRSVLNHLNISKKIMLASENFQNTELKGQDRIIDICKSLEATHYINPSGGKGLYEEEIFHDNGIYLGFIEPYLMEYPQNSKYFVKGLSMLDVLMNNNVIQIIELLNEFEIK